MGLFDGGFPFIWWQDQLSWDGGFPLGEGAPPDPINSYAALQLQVSIPGDTRSGIGFVVDIPPPRRTIASLRADDTEKIEELLSVNRTEPDQLVVTAPIVENESETEVQIEKQRIENAIKRLQEWLTAAQQMQDILGQRLQNRRVKVDPVKSPAIRDAIRRLFGVDSDTITYDMFKRALEMRSKVVSEGRTKTYGPTKS